MKKHIFLRKDRLFICFFFPEKLHKLACDTKNAYKSMVIPMFRMSLWKKLSIPRRIKHIKNMNNYYFIGYQV